MTGSTSTTLSRRERQIMDILYRLKKASAAEVLENLSDPPSYSAVRTHLRILEEKGHVRHVQQGPRYIYSPTISRKVARKSALDGVLRNFFDGSHEQMVAALLDLNSDKLSENELERLAELIEVARKEGR